MSVANAQYLDPDTCWTCRDSREHFVAGAAVDQVAALAFRKPWQRVTVTAAVAVAFEAGQADATTRRGRGYGFGIKDTACAILGALAREAVRALLQRKD